MASRRFRLVGFDPSMNNWGMATAYWDPDSNRIEVDRVEVTCPVLPTGKQVRQNSIDLESAAQLYQAAYATAKGAHAVFVEVPVGSKSARAMASYGICVGVLGALRISGIPFFEVTPNEVKLAAGQKKTATKKDMIAWATAAHPEANWPTYRSNGQTLISEAKAEHQADAVATIYAGLACNAFKQFASLIMSRAA